MALDKRIEAAGAKLLAAPKPKAAAGTPGSFLMSVVKSMVLPVLPLVVGELLKKANKTTKKILAQVRDILVSAELD